jgi:pimeloyl-ACP methyl ester carboxylesterase
MLEMFIDLEHRTVNAVSFGSGSETLLAIGGWIGTWQVWRFPFELLSTDWRCVAYDHRGAGQTLTAASDLTFDGLVSDVFAVADALNVDRCWLAGESQGGLVAARAAIEQPDRFRGLITIAAPSFWEETPEREAFVRNLSDERLPTLRRFISWSMPEPNTELLQRWALHCLMEAEPEAGIALIRNLYGADVTESLADLSMPALVVHGLLDSIIPSSHAERFAELIPVSELRLLEGAGHVPTVTRPVTIAEEIRAFVERFSR